MVSFQLADVMEESRAAPDTAALAICQSNPVCVPVQPITSHQGVTVPNRPRTPKSPDHQLPSVACSPPRGEARRGAAGEADRVAAAVQRF